MVVPEPRTVQIAPNQFPELHRKRRHNKLLQARPKLIFKEEKSTHYANGQEEKWSDFVRCENGNETSSEEEYLTNGNVRDLREQKYRKDLTVYNGAIGMGEDHKREDHMEYCSCASEEGCQEDEFETG